MRQNGIRASAKLPRRLTSDCYFYGEKEVKRGLAGRTEASQALERDRSERSERWGLH